MEMATEEQRGAQHALNIVKCHDFHTGKCKRQMLYALDVLRGRFALPQKLLDERKLRRALRRMQNRQLSKAFQKWLQDVRLQKRQARLLARPLARFRRRTLHGV